MRTCSKCSGFVPAEGRVCPNCGVGQSSAAKGSPRVPVRGLAGALGAMGASGAFAMTLMACYGCPPSDTACMGEPFGADSGPVIPNPKARSRARARDARHEDRVHGGALRGASALLVEVRRAALGREVLSRVFGARSLLRTLSNRVTLVVREMGQAVRRVGIACALAFAFVFGH